MRFMTKSDCLATRSKEISLKADELWADAVEFEQNDTDDDFKAASELKSWATDLHAFAASMRGMVKRLVAPTESR